MGNGADPLRIVKPAFSLLKMGQSNPFVFASNKITVTMQSVTHTAPAGSTVTLSGLNGSATASSQAMQISCSNEAMVASGDWHADGTLEMTVAPGKALVKGSTYVVVFTITNPGTPMASPSVMIENVWFWLAGGSSLPTAPWMSSANVSTTAANAIVTPDNTNSSAIPSCSQPGSARPRGRPTGTSFSEEKEGPWEGGGKLGRKFEMIKQMMTQHWVMTW